MRRASAAQQGHIDALCGIYCLVNFLRDDPYFRDGSSPTERGIYAFQYLLEAAQRINLLTPHHLVNGYESHHLAAIFNNAADSLELDYKAINLHRFRREHNLNSLEDVLAKLRKSKGACVVGVDDNSHWVLARKVIGTDVEVADSANASKKRYRVGDLDISQGVALISGRKDA
jgi:hypothetical protein